MSSLATGCGSVWLERSVRDAEAARSNRAIPTRKIKGLCESMTPFLRPPLRLPWPPQGKHLPGRPAKNPAAWPSRQKNTFSPGKGSAAEARERGDRHLSSKKSTPFERQGGRRTSLEHFPFETLCASPPTTCRFTGKRVFSVHFRPDGACIPFSRKNVLAAGTGIYTTLK